MKAVNAGAHVRGHAESHVDPAVWVETHGDALFRFAMLRLRDRNAAEEAVQECFLAALNSSDRFSGRSSERTWLIGILKHKIVDTILARRRDKNNTSTESESEFFNEKGLWKRNPHRWQGDPVAAIENEEFCRTLSACLAKLPEESAGVFMLREVDRMDGEEICRITGITPAGLWQRLHRARLVLRQCLELNWFRPPKSRRGVS